jgi:hypothetical protein
MSEPQHIGTIQFARSEIRSSQEVWLGTPLRQRLIPLRLPRISLKPTPIHFAEAGSASRVTKPVLTWKAAFGVIVRSDVGQII